MEPNRKTYLPPKAWALIDQGVQSASNFVTMVLAGKFLTVNAFAEFSLAYLAVIFAASFHRTWITQPMNVLGGTNPHQLGSRANALWRAHFIIIPTGFLIVVALSPFGFDKVDVVLAACGYLGFQFLQEMKRREAHGALSFRTTAAMSVMMAGIQTLGIGGLAYGENGNSSAWICVMAVAQIIGLLTGKILSTCKADTQSDMSVKAVLIEQLSHSRWVIASQFVYWGSSQIYPFLVASVDTSQAASFNAGMSVLNVFNIIRMSLASYLPAATGRIIRQGGEMALATFTISAMRRLLILGSVLWGAVFVLAAPAVEILYGAKYDGATLVIQWAAAGMVASLVSVVMNAAALSFGISKSIFISNACGAAFTVTIGIYLTTNFGIQGAIIGGVVGYILPAAIQLACLIPKIARPS